MIYQLFVWIFRLVCRIYFRKIEIHGPSLPRDRPLLLVANHPSALMDAIVLAVYSGRSLYFMTRGESFDKSWKRWMWQCLHMIPIYRRAHTPGLTRHNPRIFRRCHRLFARGKAILIFPEGISKTEPRLRPIKTGAAQIALGSSPDVDLALVPIGLHYSDPHRFRSELIVNLGKEIELAPFRKSGEQNLRDAVQQLSGRIETALKELTVCIDDPESEELIDQLERHYKDSLLAEPPQFQRSGSRSFLLSQDIVRAVAFFQTHSEARVRGLRFRLAAYCRRLEAYGLTRLLPAVPSREEFRGERIAVAALAICKWLFFPPLFLTRLCVRLLCRRADFVGSLQLLFGSLFALMYAPLLLGLMLLFMPTVLQAAIALSAVVVLSWLGLVGFDQEESRENRLIIGSLQQKQARQIDRLIRERDVLMNELHRLKKIFLRAAF